MLCAFDLQCIRAGHVLFSRLGFTLSAGEALNVQGSNGSGKSSLLRIVCGLLPPCRGQVSWRGESIFGHSEEFHREVAYLGHGDGVKDELTARENLNLASLLTGEPICEARTAEALASLDLAHLAHMPGRRLSQGQRRRVALARFALSRKPLWLLDEPCTALDTDAADRFGVLLHAHLASGGMALVATHQPMNGIEGRVRHLHLGMPLQREGRMHV
jgi:heme exporter protein A